MVCIDQAFLEHTRRPHFPQKFMSIVHIKHSANIRQQPLSRGDNNYGIKVEFGWDPELYTSAQLAYMPSH